MQTELPHDSQQPEPKSGLSRTVKIVNRLGLTSLFLGIAAALVKAWVTHWLGPGSVAVSPVAAPVVASAEPRRRTIENLLQESPVSLMEWQATAERHYESSAERERQFRAHLGKQVVWEGYFDQVNRVPGNDGGKASTLLVIQESRSSLFEKRLLGPPCVRCWLPEESFSGLASLKRGDWIAVRGQLADPMLAGSLLCTDLQGCEVLAAGSVRAVEIAVEEGSPQLR